VSTEREAYIEQVVNAAPPLRPEQIAKLSALFDCEAPPAVAHES
jgi:hypothetical protein